MNEILNHINESERGGLLDLGKALRKIVELRSEGGEGTQELDATLTALAQLSPSAGVLYQTGADSFEKRAIGTESNNIASGDHNHNNTYASISHSHPGVYSLVTHNHNGTYLSAITPATLGDFPIINETGGLSSSGLTPSSFIVPTRSVLTTHSLTGGGDLSANRTLSLVGDAASPGNNMVYGTNGVGVKGWKTDPAGEGATFTSEEAQDAVGTILVDSASIDFTYNDATPSITASVIFGTTATTVAAGNHDHSAVQLAQANTHQSPDTDTATTSLHHTIGSGANQAAAGNHTHAQLHDAVTLSATPRYLSLTGQEISPELVDLTAHITGNLPVTNIASGTNASVSTFLRGDMSWAAPPGGGEGITMEDAQDAVGTILTDSASIDFTYDDVTPTITATVIFGTTATTATAGNDARLSDARTPTAHDHSTNKLAQANTHESVDTDVGPTSIHHTLGTGDHTHAQLHDAVTLAGTPDYITLAGQVLTRGLVELTTDISGNLPVAHLGSGTGASATTYLRGDMTWQTPDGGGYTNEEAQDAVGTILVDSSSIDFTYNDATPSITASVIFGTTADTVAAGNHNHDASYISVVGTPTTGNFPVLTAGGELNNSTYSNASFATAAQGALADTALQDADIGTIATQSAASVAITGGSITGITDLAIADGGTGASTASEAFTALKQAATDTATGVVELATDAEVVTGTDTTRAVTAAGVAAQYMPLRRTTATETGTTRTNAASDATAFVRFTNTGAKSPVISSGVAATGDTWIWFNAAVSGKMTISGSGMTLTGNLVFDPLKGAMIRFTSSSAADVIGGTAT